MKYQDVVDEFKKRSSDKKAVLSQRFFKTASGEYGYGDVFWGISVPQNRLISKKFKDLPLKDIVKLVEHDVHEIRLCGLLILIDQYKSQPKQVFQTYIANKKRINNWDLVDLSADKIVGAYLENNSKKILYDLAQSKSLWDRRIAIVSTFYYIKRGCSKETFKIADILLNDKEDLIHKAVGWMLREVGKRCSTEELEIYLRERYKKMPRTMLRYAIERFSMNMRKKYLAGQI